MHLFILKLTRNHHTISLGQVAPCTMNHFYCRLIKKINKYKYDRVVIANKMHATPKSSENDESGDDFKQKNH